MHPWRPITLVGAALAGFAMVFPFATMPVLGVFDGIDADAWPSLIPLIPVFVVALFGDWATAPRPAAATVLVGLACLATLSAVAKAIDAVVAVRGVDGASTGAGTVVLLAGTLVTLTGTLVALSRSLR